MPRHRERLIRLLAAIVVCGAMLAGLLPRAASAATTPAVRVGGVQCLNGGVMRVSPPTLMAPVYPSSFRNAEQVWWTPDVQVLTRGGWREYYQRRATYTAFTSSYGFFQPLGAGGVWLAPNGSYSSFVPFVGLRAGTYRVRNWLQWSMLRGVYYVDSPGCRFV